MRPIRICPLLALALMTLSMPASANAQGSTIRGTIRTPAGDPIRGAEVQIVGTDRRDTTDTEGRYQLVNVTLDRVQLRVSFVGYVTLETGALLLLAGQVLAFDLVLPEAPVIVCPPCDRYEQRPPDS
jgi:hypothetical protein